MLQAYGCALAVTAVIKFIEEIHLVVCCLLGPAS